jgi:CDGSH-type Zn-finger protein
MKILLQLVKFPPASGLTSAFAQLPYSLLPIPYSPLSILHSQLDYPIFAPNKTIMSKTKLTINSNGSVKIEGDFEIVDRNGGVYGLQGRTVLSICRCGLSKNKPFCDGSHNGHFEHDAIAFDLPPKKV